VIVFTCDGMKLENIANVRWCWAKRAKHAAAQRMVGRLKTRTAIAPARMVPPYVITITRIGPRALDDDNLAISGKHIRDGIADALGIDDGHASLTWRYAQERPAKGAPRYGVRVAIERRTAA
jgi:hypothetical protein